MSKQLIFGFLPNGDEGIENGLAISFREDFQTEDCMNDNYPDEFYTMFQRWQELGIYEEMESVFSCPKNAEDIIEDYLRTFNVQRDYHFEIWLSEND